MSDERPPQQPKTKELPKPTQAEIQLSEILALSRAMRADVSEVKVEVSEVKDDVVKVKGTVDFIQNDAKLTKEEFRLRFIGIEGRVTDLESARVRNSERARDASKTDLSHEAKIADEIGARKRLEEQLAEEKAKREKLEASMVTKQELAIVTAGQTSAIVDGVKNIAKKPMVQKIFWALGGLILVAINAATTWLATKGH